MRVVTTLILLGAVVGLFFFLAHMEENVPSTAEHLELEGRVWSYANDEFAFFRVERSGKPPLALARDGDEWFLEEPLRAPADQGMVDGFLDALSGLEVTRRFLLEDNTDRMLSDFGLSDPAQSVMVNFEDGSTRKLEIGMRTPVGDNRFARVSGEAQILVVGPGLIDWMNWPLEQWRERRVLRFDPYDVKAISLNVRERSLKLERPSADWLIVYPVRFPADADVVGRLLAKLSGLRIRSFLEDGAAELEPYGLDPSVSEIRITLRQDGSERALLWGHTLEGRDVEIACMLEGGQTVWGVLEADITALEKDLTELRQSRVLSFRPHELRALSLAHAGHEVELVKDETEEWDRARALVKKIARFRATEFLDLPRELDVYGLREPAIRLKALLDAPQREETLLFGRVQGDEHVYVKLGDYDSIFVIDSAAADLVKQEIEFWSKP